MSLFSKMTMMKKTLILLACLTLAMSASAQVSNITTKWCKLLDAAPPDMGIDLLLQEQSLYFLSCTGSSVGAGDSGFPKDYTDSTASVYYDGTLIGHTAAYEGSGFNNNFNLLKTDLNGEMQWCVYSTSGDMSSSGGGVVSAPDGGVYVSFVMRHTDNMRTEPLRFVDGAGLETIIDWRLENQDDKRWWQGFVMKVSRDGAIEWVRTIEVSHAAQPNGTGENASHTSSAFYIYDMESDAMGNFYITGRYVNPITLQGLSEPTVLTPHNTEGWDGDSQESRGDLFVAKFDHEGWLLKTLITTGVAQVETSSTLTRFDDGIILNFVVTGMSDGGQIALDGHEIALTHQASLITAQLDDDLSAEWVQRFRGDVCGGRNSVIQNNQVQVIGDYLWITGQANFTLYSEDETQHIATQNGNIREGFVIKCDKNTGKWVKGACSKQGAMSQLQGICGYVGGFEGDDGKFYACGYTFASRVVETDDDYLVEGYGVILVEHDGTTLEILDFCSLISGGSMSTAQDMIATDNKLYTLSRGRNQNNADWMLKPIGSDQGISTLDWAVVFSAFELPFKVKDDSAELPGDVNGDNSVDISDVNMIINIMLGKSAHNAAADMNGDGGLDISDVNAVINIMLGKS